MPRLILLPAAALASALALGCAEQWPTAPVSGAASSPSFARSSNGTGGAIVSRGTVLVGFFFSDPDRGLTTLMGNTAAELAGVCAGTTPPEAASVLEVIRPTGAVKQLLKDKERSAVVWSLVSGDLCGVLAVTPPLAEGTARMRITDNDVFFPIEPGANAFGIHAQGRVTNVETGEALHYLAVFHHVLPPGATGFEDQRVLRSDIKLR